MELRLVVVTVGFDEKLPLRGLLKLGLEDGDIVALVYSKSGGELDVKRVENAVQVLREIMSRVGADVVDVVVSGMDFYADVLSIARTLKKYKVKEVIAILAGGMRLVIFELLLALLLNYRLNGITTKILLYREDGLYSVMISAEMFHVSLPSRGLDVLRVLREWGEARRRVVVETIAREQGVSESLVYKLIEDLAQRGLVTIEDDTVKLSPLGVLALEVVRPPESGREAPP